MYGVIFNTVLILDTYARHCRRSWVAKFSKVPSKVYLFEPKAYCTRTYTLDFVRAKFKNATATRENRDAIIYGNFRDKLILDIFDGCHLNTIY